MNQQLSLFGEISTPAPKLVNVASVPKRSPFRYPGGKTWLIPVVRQWLRQNKQAVPFLVEPFAGGGIVGLTAAFEQLAHQVQMAEIDPEIAAVWKTILGTDNQWLADKILSFDLTLHNIQSELERNQKNTRELAFCTILKNRICHGGIISKGSGFIKNGENGKGISSRWYARTLYDRIKAIELVKNKIEFVEEDAFQILEKYKDQIDTFFFIDPPYTIAGKRLYTYFDIDHRLLFEKVAHLRGHYLLTYDDTEEIRSLAVSFGLKFKTIPMKTTHHLKKNEILISDNLNW